MKNTFNYILKVKFTSEWLTSSGIGDGYVADTVLNADDLGIPVLGGRAIRGALRESAWRMAMVDSRHDDLTKAENYFFGLGSDTAENEPSGCVKVGMGHLSDNLHEHLASLDEDTRKEYLQDFSVLRVQTTLEDKKKVKRGSLRTIQCGVAGLCFDVPLEITTSLSEEYVKSYFVAICAGVKSIGANRARGLGNCELFLCDNKSKNPIFSKDKRVCLPKKFELPEVRG